MNIEYLYPYTHSIDEIGDGGSGGGGVFTNVRMPQESLTKTINDTTCILTMPGGRNNTAHFAGADWALKKICFCCTTLLLPLRQPELAELRGGRGGG